MHNAIKKKIVAIIAVIVLAFQFVILSCSPVYSCLTQNPKVLYYAICFQLEQNCDKSFHGKINSVLKGIQIYSTLKPLFNKNDIKLCWIDIWGYVQKKLGIIFFPGIDEDMVYLNNGHLVFLTASSVQIDNAPSEITSETSEITSETYCEKFKEVYQYFIHRDIEFLNIIFPRHLHQKTVLPYGLKDNYNQISADRIKLLHKNGIPTIDTQDLFKDLPDVHYQLFYKGDHHWVPEYAFKAYIYLSQELEKQHSPMAKFFDCENMAWNDYYIEKRLPPFHSYLGSGVRRIGRLYLPERDVTPYMIPRYKTDFTFQVPSMGINKTGSVDDTFLEFFNDVPIEIIINNRADNKNRIIVFHNSFIHSFVPFLALNNYCLYMIDLRHFQGNVIDLIEQEKPDSIIFAYTHWAPFSHIELLERQIQEKQKLNNASKKD